MFKIDVSPQFWAAVKIEMTNEAGARQRHTFDIQFPRLSTDEIQAIRDRTMLEKATDHEIAKGLVKGWRGVASADGEELPFNEANLDRLLQLPGVGTAIALTFFENVAKAAAKN